MVSCSCSLVNLYGASVKAEAACHRGPDGIRCWRGGQIGLANFSLNSAPASVREHQPLIGRRGDQNGLACADQISGRLGERGLCGRP
jgi:hypothetical protein